MMKRKTISLHTGYIVNPDDREEILHPFCEIDSQYLKVFDNNTEIMYWIDYEALCGIVEVMRELKHNNPITGLN